MSADRSCCANDLVPTRSVQTKAAIAAIRVRYRLKPCGSETPAMYCDSMIHSFCRDSRVFAPKLGRDGASWPSLIGRDAGTVTSSNGGLCTGLNRSVLSPQSLSNL